MAALAARTPGTFHVLTPPVTAGGVSNDGFQQLVVDTAAKVKPETSYAVRGTMPV